MPPHFHDEYEYGYPGDPDARYLGAAPHALSQRVKWQGHNWYPVQGSDGYVDMRPPEGLSNASKSKTYRGPVRLPNGRFGIIPFNRADRAFYPRGGRQRKAVDSWKAGAHAGTWAALPPRRNRSRGRGPPQCPQPQPQPPRNRSRSRGPPQCPQPHQHQHQQRGRSCDRQAHGSRSGSADSRASIYSTQGKRKAQVPTRDPALGPVNMAMREVQQTKRGEKVAIPPEKVKEITDKDTKVFNSIQEREGVFKYVEKEIIQDVKDMPTGKLNGMTREEAMKILRKVKDKLIRVLKSAKKTHYLHEQHKASKVALLAANLPGENYDEMSWESTAVKISGLSVIKIKDRTQFLDILPYVIWRMHTSLKGATDPAAKPDPEKAKEVRKALKTAVLAWLCSNPAVKIEGFQPAVEFVGTKDWTKLVDDAIQAAHEIKLTVIRIQTDAFKRKSAPKARPDPMEPESGYSDVTPYSKKGTDTVPEPYENELPPGPAAVEGFASCWHEDGNFSLCHALHAQLTREGVDMGPSPYAPLRSRAEGSAGGVRSRAGFDGEMRSRVGFDGEMRSRSDLPPEPSSRSYLPTVSMARY